MRRAEMIAAVALAIGAMVLVREALRLPITWTGAGPGAGFFPLYLAVGVGVCAVALVVKYLRANPSKPDESFIPAGAWKPLLIVILPMMAIVGLINYLGLYIGGAIYLAGYMWLVGRYRWVVIVPVSLLIPVALFFLFERWFLLPMPGGAILEYLLYKR
ncbi:MAG TPA: tripartite tricarboxylate transporter TctB family protein [bacterium]|nr:tripartite tricarboxylate transporter TctB family protein [bacterium]